MPRVLDLKINPNITGLGANQIKENIPSQNKLQDQVEYVLDKIVFIRIN